MATVKWKAATVWLALGTLVLLGLMPAPARAQAAAVDPAAVQSLKRMTDYLGGLQQFSVHTQNTIEDLLDSGQRIDYAASVSLVVSRPNRLRAERRGDMLNQAFYYDGRTLTLYDPSRRAYGTESVPGTIEGMLDFARESLGLVVPIADLVYRNAFELLMQDVSSATVVGKAVIGGVKCDHLAFRRPGVDFQVWVTDGAQPLPRKYVVTDTGTPALLSVSSVMSEWNVAPAVADDRFTFVPPQGAREIPFMRLDVNGGR